MESEFSDKVSTRRKPHSKINTACKAKSRGPSGTQSRDGCSDFEDHVNKKNLTDGETFFLHKHKLFFHNPTRFGPLAILMNNINVMGKHPRSSRCVELDVACPLL